MMHGSVVDLFVLLIGGLTVTLIGAVILKASCALYNMLASASAKASVRLSPRVSESEPETGITTEPGSAPTRDDHWPDHVRIETSPAVPQPSLEWAMCIFFVAALVNALCIFIAYRFLRLAGLADRLSSIRALPAHLAFSLWDTLVLGGINAAMLPTRFGKGLLIALLFLFLSLLVAAVVVVIWALAWLAFGLRVARLG